MSYKIGDEQFLNECQLNAFANQIDGYPFGHPARSLAYRPILVMFGNQNGEGYNRELMVNATAYSFTDEQKKALLEQI